MTIIRGEGIEAYHAHAAISNSKRRDFAERGPWYFRGRHIDRTIPPDEPTKALIEGQQFDTLVTEGLREYEERYVVKPEGLNLATKAGMTWKEAVAGKDVISAETHARYRQMQAALQAHPIASALIDSATDRQITARITSQKYGLDLQSRPDFASRTACAWSEGHAWSANLKTTADFSAWFKDDDPEHPHAGAPVYTYGYHLQAALDQYILYQHPEYGQTAHFLIVVEKQQPYRVGVVRLAEEYLELGFEDVHRDLTRIRRCMELGLWPKSPHTILTLKPPQWLLDAGVRKAQHAPTATALPALADKPTAGPLSVLEASA